MATAYQLVDPGSKLSFSHDWDDWLVAGDSIISRQWRIEPLAGSPGLPTLTGDTTDTVFVEGLEPGKIYWLTEHIVCDSGNEDERTIVLRCEQT